MRNELTKREQTILNLLVDGISPKDIAYKLSISNRTLDFHRNNIYKKLDVHSIQELVSKYKSTGQNTETASSTVPALSVNTKNRKLKRLIPLGIGILIGVVFMSFIGWFFMKSHGGVVLIPYIYGFPDGLARKKAAVMVKVTIQCPL